MPDHRKGISFQEMIKAMRAKGFEVVYPSYLEEEIPDVDLQPDNNLTVDSLMRAWLTGLNVKYQILGNNLILYRASARSSIYRDLTGVIVGEAGEPLEMATVINPATGRAVSTNSSGWFRVPVKNATSFISISCIGYATRIVELSNRETQVIRLSRSPSGLDAIVKVAYGVTSRRVNTASVFVVNDVGNAMSAPASGNMLDGLKAIVPGLFISQSNGVPGSAYSMMLGGIHSLQQNNDPLVVVDGVPWPANGSVSAIGSGSAQGPGGASLLNTIPPASISSITILKDAAATSLYGSRASNGVILISLKTGKPGELRVSAEVNSGVRHAVKMDPLLSTAQFLQLRKEAVVNDGLRIDSNTVPEMFAWSPSRQTNFRRLTTGAPAWFGNGCIQASGGGIKSNYFLSGQIRSESTVFPAPTSDQRSSLYGHWMYRGTGGRLQLSFTGMASQEINHLPMEDYSFYAYLAPNAPSFVDVAGKSQWGDLRSPYVNIPALRNNDYSGHVDVLLAHGKASYQVNTHLSLEENLGFNGLESFEQAFLRIAGQDPEQTPPPVGSSFVTRNRYGYTMSETIGRWKGDVGGHRLEALMGLNWQGWSSHYQSVDATGYTSDRMLGKGTGASRYVWTGNPVDYSYASLFWRVNYAIRDRYLFMASGRREGSTRLGTRVLDGNFGSVGAAWIFSREPFFRANRILSFGKLKASWGTTGNQLRENIDGVMPEIPAGKLLPWELSYYAGLGLELGFLEDKVLFSAEWSDRRTANQLLNSPGPLTQSGVASYVNLSGIVIENRALELTIETNQLKWGPFLLHSAFMFTLPQNRLLYWPGGVAGAYYGNFFVPGRSLSVTRSYHYKGVDPATGYYTFQTPNSNGTPEPGDEVPDKGLDVHYYAGWSQVLQYGRLRLEFVLDYRKQNGLNPLVLLAEENAPGTRAPEGLSNGPVEWLDHWRKPGDIVSQQRPTSGGDPLAMDRLWAWFESDARIVDASFLRLKSLSLGWDLPVRRAQQKGMKECRVYIRGENLLTLTRFPVTDPETQDPRVLPPLRTLSVGWRVGF